MNIFELKSKVLYTIIKSYNLYIMNFIFILDDMSQYPVIDKSVANAWKAGCTAINNDKHNVKRSTAYNKAKKETAI